MQRRTGETCAGDEHPTEGVRLHVPDNRGRASPSRLKFLCRFGMSVAPYGSQFPGFVTRIGKPASCFIRITVATRERASC